MGSNSLVLPLLLLLATIGLAAAQDAAIELGSADNTDDAAATIALAASSDSLLPTTGTRDPAVLAALPVPKFVKYNTAIATVLTAATNNTGISLRPRIITATVAARIVAAEAVAEAEALVSAAGAAAPAAIIDPLTILSKHNSYRARHQQTTPLTWSDQQAANAASYAARCVFAHSTDRGGAGENLYVTTSKDAAGALSQAVDGWYGEISQYNFNAPDFSPATGHFTQVVWKATTALGCAAQVCDRISGGVSWNGGTLVVCRYTPPGNIRGQFPANVLPLSGGGGSSTPPATIPEGYQMSSPGCLGSADGRFKLCVQDDANVVLYQGTRGTWASNTSNKSTRKPFRLVMQTDGNLVAYDAGNTAFWASNTSGRGSRPYRLVVQNDGNTVLYGGNTPIWATNTAVSSG